MTLEERAKNVSSWGDVRALIAALAIDAKDNPERWENPTLPTFPEATAAWNMDGYYALLGLDVSQLPPWRIVADMLMAGRIYE